MKFSLSIVLLLISQFTLAGLTSSEIMDKNIKQQKVNDEAVTIKMELTNKKGKTRKRTIDLSSMTNNKDEQNSLIKFTAPKNISGTGLLTLESAEKEDDQWLYLPAIKRSRRISAANQTDPFMGTDFSYEDLNIEDMKSFEYSLLGMEEVDGNKAFKIEAKPAGKSTAEDSGYARRIIWVREKDFVTAQVHYFDKNDVLSKVLTTSDIKPIDNSGVSRAHLITMKNMKTQHTTKLHYGDFSINKGINTNLFTTRSLERTW